MIRFLDHEQFARTRGERSLAPQQPTVFDLPKVLAVGIVSPAAAAITARFGVGGTLVGLVLSSVFVTAGVDLLKVYLARVPGAVTSIPGGFRKKSAWGRLLQTIRLPFSKFASLPYARRRSLLIGSIAAAGISSLVGLIIVTGVEASVGKSLSCSVWNNCPTESSTSTTGDGGTSQTSTLPSILGGSQGTISNTTPPKAIPPNSQQRTGAGASPSSTPQAPSQTPTSSGSPGTGTPSGVQKTPIPSSSAQPGQGQEPSGGMEDQQQIPSSSSTPADQQQPSSSDQKSGAADQQQPSSSDQQASSSDNTGRLPKL
jgi:hypothetical protein